MAVDQGVAAFPLSVIAAVGRALRRWKGQTRREWRLAPFEAMNSAAMLGCVQQCDSPADGDW